MKGIPGTLTDPNPLGSIPVPEHFRKESSPAFPQIDLNPSFLLERLWLREGTVNYKNREKR